MAFTVSHIILLVIWLFPFQYCSCYLTSLKKGSSLSVEKYEEDVIVSSNGIFSAGFYQIGENAFSFAIWFTELQYQSHNTANIVWMANREQLVNGKHSKLFLLNTGNILLLDAGQHNIWSSNTASNEPLELYLKDDGNLVLRELQGTTILWQSCDFPTNTLLPNQPLARHTNLVSSRSQSNHSSGFYKLFFDDNNIIRLDYDGPDVSSTYWPPSSILPKEAGRFNYNITRIALLDSLGRFISSDNYIFFTNDYGMAIQRRLTIDSDGNIRVYSRNNLLENWYVSWQVISDTCIIHGICGPNSTCSYDPKNGKKCSCFPGYKVKNRSDWSYGCKPMFDFTCNRSESTFLKLKGYELYGYDSNFVSNITYKNCENFTTRKLSISHEHFRGKLSSWEAIGISEEKFVGKVVPDAFFLARTSRCISQEREYWKAIEKYRQEHPEYHSYEDIPDIIRREIFLEVSGPGKKNKKYGFGKLAPNVHRQNLFHIPTPEECSRPASFTPAAQAEIQRLSRELQAQKEEMARRDQQIAAMVQEEVRKQVAMYQEQMSASSVRKTPNDDDDDDVDSSDDEDPSVSSDSN
ncbi:hypothetical protein P8452_64597 [Trifolium repens]|nr:putative receptor protein kinase ZmPK1 [Trifolium repens]WJX81752.1 hypothetical protein P8452_64597 [Trifolium repens]